MELINKKIQVQHDPVAGLFTVSLMTDTDGTVWVKDAKNVKEVLYLIGNITRMHIDYIE